MSLKSPNEKLKELGWKTRTMLKDSKGKKLFVVIATNAENHSISSESEKSYWDASKNLLKHIKENGN